MICSVCKKNKADVAFKQISHNQVTLLSLCSGCAAKLASGPGPEISMLVEMLRGAASPPAKCPACGIKYSEFQESGRLGCPECYEAFKPVLSDLFAQIHGKAVHKGRRPAGGGAVNPTLNVEQLKRKLKAAIDEERFEEAASLRDRIRELEKGN